MVQHNLILEIKSRHREKYGSLFDSEEVPVLGCVQVVFAQFELQWCLLAND